MDDSQELKHSPRPNIKDGQIIEEDEDEGMIPNEFSDENESEQDDMDEFIEHEEEFEARQSISSRGRETRTKMMPGQPGQRSPTRVVNDRENADEPEFREGTNAQYEFAEGDAESSSVITEIVEERVMEINSEDEEHKLIEGTNEEDRNINNYLDINQQDYVNKEYAEDYHRPDESSPERVDNIKNPQVQNEDQYRQLHEEGQKQVDEGYEYEENQDHEANEYEQMYHRNMMENSPIEENPMEEELTASPQYYEAPRVMNPKYRK